MEANTTPSPPMHASGTPFSSVPPTPRRGSTRAPARSAARPPVCVCSPTTGDFGSMTLPRCAGWSRENHPTKSRIEPRGRQVARVPAASVLARRRAARSTSWPPRPARRRPARRDGARTRADAEQPGLTAAAPEISWKESWAFFPDSKPFLLAQPKTPNHHHLDRNQERIVITPARPSREDTELFHGE